MPEKKKPAKVNNSGGSRVPTKPHKNLIPDDYVYAKEVAGQPADNRIRALHKLQAKLDVAALEKKYPYIRKEYDVKGQTVVNTYKTYGHDI
jgi:hypothetical protein